MFRAYGYFLKSRNQANQENQGSDNGVCDEGWNHETRRFEPRRFDPRPVGWTHFEVQMANLN